MVSNPSYECKLSEESLTKAEEELSEEPNERPAQLKQFADWIEQEKKWLTSPTDPVFLLSFLRVRKFSQLLARETLVNYIINRDKESQYFKTLDCDDAKIQAVLKLGFYLPLPNRDIHGRRVIIIRPARLDISGKMKHVDIFRTVFMILDYLLMDENMQVNGMAFILDYSGITMKHQTYIGEGRQKFLKLLTKTYPIRFKNIFIYNVGPFMEVIVGIIKSVLKDKLQKRIETFTDMLGIYDKVGKSILPLDYLPDDYEGQSPGTCDSIMENLIAELRKPEVTKWIGRLSSDEVNVDEKKMPPREEIFQAAFRTKLNID